MSSSLRPLSRLCSFFGLVFATSALSLPLQFRLRSYLYFFFCLILASSLWILLLPLLFLLLLPCFLSSSASSLRLLSRLLSSLYFFMVSTASPLCLFLLFYCLSSSVPSLTFLFLQELVLLLPLRKLHWNKYNYTYGDQAHDNSHNLTFHTQTVTTPLLAAPSPSCRQCY